MGRNIYLTDKEIQAIRDTATEWCDMMSDGNDQSLLRADKRLNEGLGSALKKLYKGANGEHIYQNY